MLTISATALAEKNKLATTSVFMLALMVTIPGVGTPVRVVANSEDITWQGETWVAFPFEIEEISDNNKGEVPSVEVRVGNVNRSMEAYIHAYDAYCKANGFSPIVMNIYVVNSENLGSATPEVEYEYELKKPKTNPKWATFTLGASNLFTRRCPAQRVLKDHCRFKFKSTRCGYSGEETACDKTLTRCRALSNSARFGGAPGIGSRGIYIV